MKKTKILFWVSTVIIVLFEGLLPALTGHTEPAKEAMRHLGYPDYFSTMLVLAKVLGALALIVPQVPMRLKEWAYAGFTFTLIGAAIGNWVVDGFGFMTVIFPLIVLGILMVSYTSFHKLHAIPPATPKQ